MGSLSSQGEAGEGSGGGHADLRDTKAWEDPATVGEALDEDERP